MSNNQRPRTYEQRYVKWPQWFRDWQQKFYHSKEWKAVRSSILEDRGMISDYSGTLITGKAVVDHIVEITPDNYEDENITLNPNNLQLLSFGEHNRKTFGDLPRDSVSNYNLNKRQDSLF